MAAAINHWHKAHGPLTAAPKVTLPPMATGKIRWLRQPETALLLAGALGFYREGSCDVASRSERVRWCRDQANISRHVARFIILGLRTGTKRGALLDLAWMPNTSGAYIEFERGVIHRAATDEFESRKRKPPSHFGSKLLTHLRIWRSHATNQRRIITFRGKKVASIRRSWKKARQYAYPDEALRNTSCDTHGQPGSCRAELICGKHPEISDCHRKRSKKPTDNTTRLGKNRPQKSDVSFRNTPESGCKTG